MDKEKREEFRINALLFRGIDVDKEGEKSTENEPIFKDPSEYENLSDEDKKKLTEKMKNKISGISSTIKSMGDIKNG